MTRSGWGLRVIFTRLITGDMSEDRFHGVEKWHDSC